MAVELDEISGINSLGQSDDRMAAVENERERPVLDEHGVEVESPCHADHSALRLAKLVESLGPNQSIVDLVPRVDHFDGLGLLIDRDLLLRIKLDHGTVLAVVSRSKEGIIRASLDRNNANLEPA